LSEVGCRMADVRGRREGEWRIASNELGGAHGGQAAARSARRVAIGRPSRSVGTAGWPGWSGECQGC